jgi:hypothetical protein
MWNDKIKKKLITREKKTLKEKKKEKKLLKSIVFFMKQYFPWLFYVSFNLIFISFHNWGNSTNGQWQEKLILIIN